MALHNLYFLLFFLLISLKLLLLLLLFLFLLLYYSWFQNKELSMLILWKGHRGLAALKVLRLEDFLDDKQHGMVVNLEPQGTLFADVSPLNRLLSTPMLCPFNHLLSTPMLCPFNHLLSTPMLCPSTIRRC